MSVSTSTHHFESLEVVNKAVDKGNVDDEQSTTVHGVALGEGDITVGKSGIKKKWPKETLKEAASTLAGQPLVVDHENDSNNVVGRVTKAAYKEGVGVVYEAELFDSDLAQKVKDGLLEVSIRGVHGDPEKMPEDDETGAKVVQNLAFQNLSIVPNGAAPSNSLDAGEHEELEAAELSAALADTPTYTELAADSPPVDAPNASEDDSEPSFDEQVMKDLERMADESDADVDTLKEVYRRGWQAYADKEDPGISRASYAMARVNAFLDVLDTEEPDPEAYTADNDLLPEGHPQKQVADADEEDDDSSENVNTGGDSGGDEEAAKSAYDVGEGNPQPSGDSPAPNTERTMKELYRSPDEAEQRAKDLGISGFHEVQIAGGTLYMPGDNHRDLKKALREEFEKQKEQKQKESEENAPEDPHDPYSDDMSAFEKECAEAGIEAELLDSLEDVDKETVYEEFHDAVNMDADTVALWSRHPLSSEAGLQPHVIRKRVKFALKKDFGEWDNSDFEFARRCVSFLTKMRSKDDAELRNKHERPTEHAVMLMNWGYCPFDSLPEEPDPSEELALHFPQYDTIDGEGEWSKPALEDFTDESWDNLDDETRAEIADHFLYSETQFPPEDFGDLKFPVVDADGALVLEGLRTAKQFIPRADIPDDEKDQLRNITNDLAKREFGRDWGTDEDSELAVDIPTDVVQVLQTQVLTHKNAKATLPMLKEVYRRGVETYPGEEASGDSEQEWALERVRHFTDLLDSGLPPAQDYTEDNDLLPKNHPRFEPMAEDEKTEVSMAGFRDDDYSAQAEQDDENLTSDTMTDNDTEQRIEELEARVEELEERNDELLDENESVRREYAEALAGDSAFTADELVDKFTVEELAEKYEEHEDAELASAPDKPAPETGDASEEELAQGTEDEDEADEERIASLEAQLSNYEDMGWDHAAESTRAELEELRE